jgi:hypothetical protein
LGTVILLLQLLPALAVMFAGQVITGGWLSTTVTLKQQLLVRPLTSFTV